MAWGRLSSDWTEKEFQSEVERLVAMYGGIHYHTQRSRRSPAGYPDLTIVIDGRVIFAELKTDAKTSRVSMGKWKEGARRPTYRLGQVDWLDALAEAHEEVYLWRPRNFEEIVSIMAGQLKGRAAESHWLGVSGS